MTQTNTNCKLIVITSGKGGVGKTTTTANIGAGLAMKGYKVALIDTDTGLRNLDLLLGLENRIMYDLVDVTSGKIPYKKALVRHKKFYTLFFDSLSMFIFICCSLFNFLSSSRYLLLKFIFIILKLSFSSSFSNTIDLINIEINSCFSSLVFVFHALSLLLNE